MTVGHFFLFLTIYNSFVLVALFRLPFRITHTSIGTYFLQWLGLSPPEILTFPPESPCTQAWITFILVLFWIFQFDFCTCRNSLRIGQSIYQPTCPQWRPHDAIETIPNSQILIPVHLYFPSLFTMLGVSRIDTMKFYVPIPTSASVV